MEKKTDFPHGLFALYAEKEITRERFIAGLAAWQKSRGVNFDCKGTGDRYGVHLAYRGVRATISGGFICWYGEAFTDRKGRTRRDKQTARTVFEFRRMVDFALLREFPWKGGDRCRELKP